MAKEQGLMPVNNNLEQKFNNKQQEAKQKLNFANQEITNQYNNKVPEHKQHVGEMEDSFNGESQTK